MEGKYRVVRCGHGIWMGHQHPGQCLSQRFCDSTLARLVFRWFLWLDGYPH